MKFSDETLLMYLEGKLDHDTASAIEGAVAEDAELESRLMALDPIAPIVQSVFENVPAQPRAVDLPAPDGIEVPAPNPAMGIGRLLAVAASVSVIAVSATFWATRPAPMGWTAQAAVYQSLYSPETIAPLDNAPAKLDAQFARAEAELGRSLNRDVLETLPGLELKRTQVLSFNGKPLIQVVFADEQGQPIAFCVIQQDAGASDKDVEYAVLSGLATASWSRNGFGYVLMGSDAETPLDDNLDILTTSFAS